MGKNGNLLRALEESRRQVEREARILESRFVSLQGKGDKRAGVS